MANENRTGQTELDSDKLFRMWSYRTWVLPNSLTRTLLESRALDSDSLVEVGEKEDSKYPEYHSLDME